MRSFDLGSGKTRLIYILFCFASRFPRNFHELGNVCPASRRSNGGVFHWKFVEWEGKLFPPSADCIITRDLERGRRRLVALMTYRKASHSNSFAEKDLEKYKLNATKHPKSGNGL